MSGALRIEKEIQIKQGNNAIVQNRQFVDSEVKRVKTLIINICENITWHYNLSDHGKTKIKAIKALDAIAKKYENNIDVFKKIMAICSEMFGKIFALAAPFDMNNDGKAVNQTKQIRTWNLISNGFIDSVNLLAKAAEKNDPKKALEIMGQIRALLPESEDKRNDIQKEYGVRLLLDKEEMGPFEKLAYNKTLNRDPGNIVDPVAKYSYLNKFSGAFSEYPLSMHSKFPGRMIVLWADGFHNVGGVNDRSIYLFHSTLMSYPNKQAIQHELHHYFEYEYSGNDTKNMNRFYWSGVKEHIQNPQSFEYSCPQYDFTPGYASSYGMKNDVEDRAEVAAMLFNETSESLNYRLKEDRLLRAKVEVITGCEYDENIGRFIRVYSKNDLKTKFGVYDHGYYSLWSEKDGIVEMGPDYWNKVITTDE